MDMHWRVEVELPCWAFQQMFKNLIGQKIFEFTPNAPQLHFQTYHQGFMKLIRPFISEAQALQIRNSNVK